MLLKWIFDRIVAFFGLAVLWPVLIIVAFFIKIKMSGGSVTVAYGGSSISVAGESRITPLGAKLRRYKLDELPELLNVLIGDMSFVGPRPNVPGYADQLQGENRRVLELRPGITGPASLKYRDEEELLAKVEDPQKYNDEVIYPDKVRINLYYLDHYSFIKDIQMIICAVLGKRMMYGGEEI